MRLKQQTFIIAGKFSIIISNYFRVKPALSSYNEYLSKSLVQKRN